MSVVSLPAAQSSTRNTRPQPCRRALLNLSTEPLRPFMTVAEFARLGYGRWHEQDARLASVRDTLLQFRQQD